MSAKFVVSHLEQQLGPFDEAELKAKWAKGELLPIDYVYDEAKQDWILLAERFNWTGNKPEAGSPPPLSENTIKKRRPPEPPSHAYQNNHQKTQTGVEISGQSVMKEWKKGAGQGAKVKLVDGVGEIDLSPVTPGQVELVLQDSSGTMLKLQEPLRIQVQAAEPVEVVWTIATQSNVGNDTEIVLKAVDAAGAACTHYNDNSFIIRVNGSEDTHVNMRAGTAVVKFNHTKAEQWKFTLHYTGVQQLRLPEARTFDWLPGPAVKLILDGPQNLVAGSPLKVHVKAVDAYGNLAKTFQGTVILEVKAS